MARRLARRLIRRALGPVAAPAVALGRLVLGPVAALAAGALAVASVSALALAAVVPLEPIHLAFTIWAAWALAWAGRGTLVILAWAMYS